MNPEQQKSILAIALFAAFADGAKHDREREEIRRIADSLAADAGAPDLARLYQDVLLKRVTLEAAVAALTDSGEHPEGHKRQLAYEMAVCVCDADGRQSEAEQRFLNELKALLKLDAGQTAAFEREANAIVELGEAAAPAALAAAPAAAARPQANDAELDKSILNYALLNGALELLPQSWASVAIIPLQIKMVYAIGKAHGVALDQGHIREFIAAAGVGLTSQYLEQFGRKLLGGLLGKAAGKAFGSVGGAATGMAFSFATTYALGQLAKRYYAGGRVMNTALLRDTFQNLLGPAKQMQTQYLPQIQQKASTLDATQIMAMVRGA
ncbi:MAG: GTPase [Sulfuriferula multivorans]|uniref:GTPase n=1 Tax=Sulfuriferula multivorans TaxID=1559896 RepID=A0A7C9P513_9PROT|nr:GTPase [Sulfuriferula multivorans]